MSMVGAASGAIRLTLFKQVERLTTSEMPSEMPPEDAGHGVHAYHIWRNPDLPDETTTPSPWDEPIPAAWLEAQEKGQPTTCQDGSLLLPISGDDAVRGFLLVEPAGGARVWDQRDIEALTLMAGALGGAMVHHQRDGQLQQLAEAVKDKDCMLRELHHRVKNNLAVVSSLLGLQAMHLQDPTMEAALETTRYRIHAMAHIHQHLYQSPDLNQVAMDRYIQRLAYELSSTYGPPDVEIEIESDPVLLSIDQAMPLGIILNEVITNALHHAFPPEAELTGPPRIHISLHVQDKTVTLTVEDNGVGLPTNLNMDATDSLGFYLVNVLKKQLDGDLEVGGENGTSIQVSFALNP